MVSRDRAAVVPETGAGGPIGPAAVTVDKGGPGRGGWKLLLALLTGGLALVYLPLCFGQVLFFRDVGRWLYPARVFLHRSLAAGQSPFYNPQEGLGLPLAASPLYGLFYPGSWLPAWQSEARALSLSIFLHLVWGAVGMLLLARRFELGRAAALLAGFGWALSGPVTASGSAGQLLAAAAWFPWCGLGAIALASRLVGPPGRLLQGIALGALAPAAGLLLGEVFQAALGMLFGVAVALAWAWPRLDRQAARRAMLAVPAAVVLAAMLAAPVLAPLSAALGDTERSGGLSRHISEQWSLHPLRLAELVAPQAMGDPYGSYPGGPWAGDGASDERPLIYSVYLGAGLLLLALVGLRAGYRAACWGLGLLALLALLLALGRHTPLHGVFRTLVPLFGFQRAPEKYVLLLVPALALLAGFGLSRASQLPGSLLKTGLILLFPVAVLLSLPLVWSSPVAVTIGRGARHALLVLAVMVGLAVLLMRQPRAQQMVPIVLAAVCILDLAVTALPLLVFAPPSMLDHRPALAELIARDRGAQVGPPRVLRDPTVEQAIGRLVRQGEIVRHEALRYASLRPSFLTAHGLANVPGYDAGLPPVLEQLWLAGQQRALALMRLLSVDYVLLPFTGGGPPSPPGLRLVGVPGPPGVALYQVTHGRPRVYVAEQVQHLEQSQASTAAVVERLLQLESDGARIDLVDGTGAGSQTPPNAKLEPAAEPASTCRLVSLENTRIEARCELHRAGHVIFVEQYGAGWTATVDGVAAPIWRANLVMRAVPASAGARTLVLRYRPPRLQAGLAAAALAATFILGALLWAALARARRSGSST